MAVISFLNLEGGIACVFWALYHSVDFILWVCFFFSSWPAGTKQTSLLLLCVACHHCWVVVAQPNLVKVPVGVDFLWQFMYRAWEQNEKCCEGNDGEARLHTMLSPIRSYRWDAARGGALRSLNDFLPWPIQWKAHNGEVQSLHRTAGPESLWKDCNRAPLTHTCTQSKMYVTHGVQWTQSPSIWQSPVCLRCNSDRLPGTL